MGNNNHRKLGPQDYNEHRYKNLDQWEDEKWGNISVVRFNHEPSCLFLRKYVWKTQFEKFFDYSNKDCATALNDKIRIQKDAPNQSSINFVFNFQDDPNRFDLVFEWSQMTLKTYIKNNGFNMQECMNLLEKFIQTGMWKEKNLEHFENLSLDQMVIMDSEVTFLNPFLYNVHWDHCIKNIIMDPKNAYNFNQKLIYKNIIEIGYLLLAIALGKDELYFLGRKD